MCYTGCNLCVLYMGRTCVYYAGVEPVCAIQGLNLCVLCRGRTFVYYAGVEPVCTMQGWNLCVLCRGGTCVFCTRVWINLGHSQYGQLPSYD